MAQRFVVIRCLRAQCESGQLLVDLFVNYDCDLEGQNLFERMVLALVRLAQGNVPQDATAQVIAEEQAMRLAVRTAPLPLLLETIQLWPLSVHAKSKCHADSKLMMQNDRQPWQLAFVAVTTAHAARNAQHQSGMQQAKDNMLHRCAKLPASQQLLPCSLTCKAFNSKLPCLICRHCTAWSISCALWWWTVTCHCCPNSCHAP